MGNPMTPVEHTQENVEGAVNGTSEIAGHVGAQSISGTFGITQAMQPARQASATQAPGARPIRWGWWLGAAVVSLSLWGAIALVLIR